MPFPYTISFPNGQNARVANLKHCRPTGIPIIVIHHMHPAKIEEIMLIRSPKDLEKFKEIYEITEEIAKEY